LKIKALQIIEGARRTYPAMAMMNKAISAAGVTTVAVAKTLAMRKEHAVAVTLRGLDGIGTAGIVWPAGM
jgi:hypothetical protein